MRTLKKTLCLVLAVVMVLGLGVFSVSAKTTADYTDAADIKNTEAVDILGTIGVLNGDEKNAFRPGDTLTRGEAAKIITTMLGVGEVNAVAPFEDTVGHWAEKYIAYCAEQGYVAGYDHKNFKPNETLTGGQFAKMLLAALGYQATTEGLVDNSSWLLNVAKLVRTSGLDNGIANFPYDEGITRDDAAQLAFNTLVTPLVEYTMGTNLTLNGETIQLGSSNAHYMTSNVRDTQTISSALVNDGSATGTYVVEFAEYYQPKLARNTKDADDFGRPATTWTYNHNKVNTYANKDLLVFSATDSFKNKEANAAVGSDLIRRIGNTANPSGITATIYWNGVEVENGLKDFIDYTAWTSSSNDDADGSDAGRLVEVYVDEDTYYNGSNAGNRGLSTRYTDVSIVVIDTFLGRVVSPVNAKGEAKVEVAVTRDGNDDDVPTGRVVTVNQADVPAIANYKEGDYVLVNMTNPDDVKKNDTANRNGEVEYTALNSVGMDIKEVLTPDVKSDVYVNAYTTRKGHMNSITTDGSKYSTAVEANWNEEILENYTLEQLKGYTYDVYYDQYGNIIGINTSSGDNSYVFLAGIEQSSSLLASSSAKANLIFMDGTMQTRTVKLGNDSAKEYINSLLKVANKDKRGINTDGDGAAAINRWFTYSQAEDGTVTLNKVVGLTTKALATDTKIAQAIEVRTDDVANKTPQFYGFNRLETKEAVYAYANDATVFLNVEINTDVKGGAISGVKSVKTGIKNESKTEVLTIDTAEYSNLKEDLTDQFVNANEAAGANVFYVYDRETRYVKAAVIVSDYNDKVAVYITSAGATGRQYINGVGYVNSYDAINDSGDKFELLAKDDDNTNLILNAIGKDTDQGRLFLVNYDEDGYAVEAEEAVDNVIASKDGAGQLTGSNNDTYGYSIAYNLQDPTKVATDYNVTLKGNTLWVDYNAGQDYVLIANGAKIYVIDRTKDTHKANAYVQYGSASSAYSAAVSGGRWIETVYTLNDGPMAKAVIFVTNGGDADNSTGKAYTPKTVTFRLAKNHVYLQDLYVIDPDAKATSGVITDVEITINEYDGVLGAEYGTFSAQPNTSVKIGEADTAYVDIVVPGINDSKGYVASGTITIKDDVEGKTHTVSFNKVPIA